MRRKRAHPARCVLVVSCCNISMIDKGRYFPGYELEEVLEPARNYEYFLARDTRRSDQWVKLQTLKPAIAHAPEIRSGYEDSCRELSRVSIPGILPVYATGYSTECGSFVAFPMPHTEVSLVEISLWRHRNQLDLSPSFYTSLLLDATRVLNVAHQQGLAHYTIMPDSITISPDGEILIGHFVEASMRRKFRLPSRFDDKHSAPEWRRNETPGIYSDVYAIASLLYLLLTDKFQPDEWEPQWGCMMNDLANADLPGEALMPLIDFFQHTLAERPSQRISTYESLIRAFEDLNTILGSYQGQKIRKFALDGRYEFFPHYEASSSTNNDALNMDSLESMFNASPLETSRLSKPATCSPAQTTIDANSNTCDASQQPLDETVTTLSTPTHAQVQLHRNATQERQQSPMMQSSLTSRPLEILAKSRYQVLEKIGTGGTGTVYKVLDTTLSEILALKVLNPSLTSTEAWLERFKTELRLTRDIDHTNILPSYHFEQIDGLYFITMKYVDGRNLAQILQDGPLPLTVALRLLIQTGQALVTAHDNGIIHRDFKPANIVIETANMHPWLMDFGIASNYLTTLPINDTGGIGTPYYMAPEQSRGDELTYSADIFSFGVVAYECLTHSLPYNGRTPLAIYEAMCSGRFRHILDIAPDVPPQIAKIIEQCLVPDAILRPTSMRLVVDVLNRNANFS